MNPRCDPGADWSSGILTKHQVTCGSARSSWVMHLPETLLPNTLLPNTLLPRTAVATEEYTVDGPPVRPSLPKQP